VSSVLAGWQTFCWRCDQVVSDVLRPGPVKCPSCGAEQFAPAQIRAAMVAAGVDR
jgi:rRNA maturation endonuclease Nob1